MNLATTDYEQAIDKVKEQMAEHGLKYFEPFGFFAGGIYVRAAFFDYDDYVISEKHLTEHPYVLMEGELEIINFDGGKHIVTAPHLGMTMPGTIRFARCLSEKAMWCTFHSCDFKAGDDFDKSVSKVEMEVIGKNKLITN